MDTSQFTSFNDFDIYKKGLETRIKQLENELSNTPKQLLDAVSPSKATPKEISEDPLIGGSVNTLNKIQVLPEVLKLRGASSLISLLPSALRIATDIVARSEWPTNVLKKLVKATELTAAEEKILADAELQDVKEKQQEAIVELVKEEPSNSLPIHYLPN